MSGFGLGANLGAGHRSGAGGGGPPPAVPVAGLVANRGYIPLRTISVTPPITYRSEHWASPQGDISALQAIWANWYYSQSTFQETNGPANLTMKAFVEYPAGTFTPILFAGAASKVVPAGFLAAGDTVAITIPAGARFWIRTVVTAIASGGSMVAWQTAGIANVVGLTDGAAAGDLGNSGTINPSTSGNVYGPVAIMGTVTTSQTARSFLLNGDSVMHGALDAASVGAKGGAGYFQRAIDPLYPWVSLACPGGTIQAQMAVTSKLSALVTAMNARGGFSDVITEHAINDLKAGRTVAQVEADHQTLHGLLGGKRIWPATVGPRTTSATNNWSTTPGDQVVRSDGEWPNFAALNAGIRGGRTGAAGFIEAGNLYASGADSGYWAAHAPQWTDDGTHPNSVGAAGIAAGLVVPG